MNATSIAPPSGITLPGRQLANVVFVPLFASTRQILPLVGSGRYSAPSGPTVLPEPAARPVTQWGVTVGVVAGGAALAATATIIAIETDRAALTINSRLLILCSPS